ncbi:MAG: hypothetical protein JSV04_00640 [Candidatus Heimdallarchaeota archaeon]|nr:MAG: hypothetical protein JSV04_00640 [Candidatus Heimdallarchaeota archaeon]
MTVQYHDPQRSWVIPATGQWEGRLKAKHLYQRIRSHRRNLKMQYQKQRQLYRIALIPVVVVAGIFVAALLGLGFFFDFFTPLFEYYPFAPFVAIFGLIGSIIIAAFLYGKAKQIKAETMRFSVLGVLSQKLIGECSKIDVFIDFNDATKTQPYRVTRSPYSGARKQYHYIQWLRFDTNLLDGTKFLMVSHQKVKTKSGGRVRDITTFIFKFSFSVKEDERLIQARSDSLEKIILDQINTYSSIIFSSKGWAASGGLLDISYPSPDIICFKLKVFGPSEHLIPSKMSRLVGDFHHLIRSSYQEYSKWSLQPLKQVVQGTQSMIEQVHRSHSVIDFERGLKTYHWEDPSIQEVGKKATTDIIFDPLAKTESEELRDEAPIRSEEELETIKGIIQVQLTFQEEEQFDKLDFYIGDPVPTISDDGEPYLKFEPKYGYLAELAVGLRKNSLVWTAVCRSALNKHLDLEIGVDPNTDSRTWETRYAEGSAQLERSPINSVYVGLKLRDLPELMRLAIHSNDSMQPIIFVEAGRDNPENIIKAFDLIKSLASELNFLPFVSS